MQGKKMWKDFRLFPNFKKAYLNTIAKLMEEGKFSDFSDPEAVMRWWVSGVNKQKFMVRWPNGKAADCYSVRRNSLGGSIPPLIAILYEEEWTRSSIGRAAGS